MCLSVLLNSRSRNVPKLFLSVSGMFAGLDCMLSTAPFAPCVEVSVLKGEGYYYKFWLYMVGL